MTEARRQKKVKKILAEIYHVEYVDDFYDEFEIAILAAALKKARNDVLEEAAIEAEKWAYGFAAARQIRALKEE